MINCSLGAKLQIAFPDEALAAEARDVEILEISENNARMKCAPLPREALSMLLEEWRGARVWLADGKRSEAAQGKIVWISQRDSPEAQLGMSLEGAEGVEGFGVRKLLEAASLRPVRAKDGFAPVEGGDGGGTGSVSWGSVMSAVTRLFVCPEPKRSEEALAKGVKLPAAAEGDKLSCRFGVDFEFDGQALDSKEPLHLEVVNISGSGLRARVRGKGLHSLVDALRRRTLSRIQICREGKGQITLERTDMRFAAPARVVWMGEKYRDRDGSVMDLALALEGAQNDSQRARKELLDMARSNPRTATGAA
jgi:hypothetical protein